MQALADLAPEELTSIAPDEDTPEKPTLAMESMVLVAAAAEEPAHNDTAEEEPESVSVIAQFILKDTGIHFTERTTPSAPVETAEEEPEKGKSLRVKNLQLLWEIPEDLFVPTETPSAEPVIMPVPDSPLGKLPARLSIRHFQHTERQVDPQKSTFPSPSRPEPQVSEEERKPGDFRCSSKAAGGKPSVRVHKAGLRGVSSAELDNNKARVLRALSPERQTWGQKPPTRINLCPCLT
ncbi:hypothetical protein AOLI_G00244950 [Acnodon oligacanthus]